MRIMRVSDLKGSRRRRGTISEPREGTRSRALWDALHAGPTRVSDFFPARRSSDAMRALQDFYGLEVERVSKGVWQAK